LPLLKQIQAYFGGIARITEENNCGYYVSSIEELTIIIPQFVHYPLSTPKLADFFFLNAL
jgi:hypothetical protein